MKKARSDSALDKLPGNQRAALDRWLFEENVSYEQARERLWQDFGVKVSHTAVCGYWRRCKQRELLGLIASSSRQADEVHKTFTEHASAFYPPLMKLIEKLAFEKMLAGEEVDVGSVADLTALLQADLAGQLKLRAEERKDRELALRKEKLELELRKYQDAVAKVQAELSSSRSSGGLTGEGLKRIEAAIGLL